MAEARKCSSCGAELPAKAPLRLCISCLLRRGLPDAPPQPDADAHKTTVLYIALTEKAGDRIGHYKLLEQIGEGGCGVVYMAEQTEPVRRRVALKVIKPGMDTKQVLARFDAERQALALMDHANIAKVLDAGATDTGRPYFVMELVKGERITDYCDKNNLPTRERLALFTQVCHAIQHAHQKGIIHRDIKPSNILVTLHDGVPIPKVIDFGIAKATTGQPLTDKTVFTAFEQFIGTPAYMSPEQAEMTGLDIDTRSDIYALGVLLYELLTGRTPFDARRLRQAGLDEIRRIIREEEPPRPSTRLSTLDRGDLTAIAKHHQSEPARLSNLLRGDLDWIVMKCLEKDRTHRYETANGLAMDIKRHLNHETVLARPPSRTYRFQKLFRRNKAIFTGTMLTGLMLVAGIIATSSQMIRANRSADMSQQTMAKLATNLYAADIFLAQNAVREGNFGLARQSLLAHVPAAGKPDLRGFEWCYFWKLCDGDKLAAWHAHSNVVSCIAASPNEKFIASAGRDHQAKLWDAQSRRLLLAVPQADCVAFSTNSAFLFTASEQGQVQIWNTRTLSNIATFSNGGIPAEVPNARLAVSPTEPLLAVSTDGNFFGNSGSVHLYDYSTLRQVGILTGCGNRMAFSADGKTLVTGASENKLHVWDVASRRRLKTFGPVGDLGCIALSPNGRLLATTQFWVPIIQLWDFPTGRPSGALQGHSAMVWSVVFSPEGQVLASSSSDQTIRLWDIKNQRLLNTMLGHDSEIWALAFSASGDHLWSGSKDETVALWPARVEQREMLIPCQHRPLNPPIISADGRVLAGPDPDGRLVLWDTSTGAPIRPLPEEKFALGFSADGKGLWTFGPNDVLHFWDLDASSVRSTTRLAPASKPISRAVASTDGKLVATASEEDSTVSVWEISSGTLRASLRGQIRQIAGMSFSSDSRRIATCGNDLVELHELARPELVVTLRGHKDGVGAVAFSPDDHTIASASVDNTVKLWSVVERRELATLRGHREGVLGVAFSPDGRTLASASADRSVKLWNFSTRREIAWIRHNAHLSYVRFSPDRRFLTFMCDGNHMVVLRCPLLADIDIELNHSTMQAGSNPHAE